MAMFLEKPETHPHAAQTDQALLMDLKPMATESIPDPAQNAAAGTGTPTV